VQLVGVSTSRLSSSCILDLKHIKLTLNGRYCLQVWQVIGRLHFKTTVLSTNFGILIYSVSFWADFIFVVSDY
jgi:hypothetical protein